MGFKKGFDPNRNNKGKGKAWWKRLLDGFSQLTSDNEVLNDVLVQSHIRLDDEIRGLALEIRGLAIETRDLAFVIDALGRRIQPSTHWDPAWFPVDPAAPNYSVSLHEFMPARDKQ